MSEADPMQQLVDHLFRHESGKMIAVLTRIFGMHHLEMVEDVVQEAFFRAMKTWRMNELPGNPSGWLMQVARNRAIDIIRRQHHFDSFSHEISQALQEEAAYTVDQFFSESEIADSQLQMIFACCHPSLKEEDQVALTLKTVSGFGVTEIARALVTNDTVIQKRLYRARQFLKDNEILLEIPACAALKTRLHIVYTVLYLLFNEGYNSMKADELIRKDLCAEAMRLAYLLSQHRAGATPATYALLALMCLQASRFDSRMDADDSIVLLKQQDRNTWNKPLIQQGYYFLNLSSQGDELTIYHLESAIAAEHCLAPTFEATNWERMLALYDMLLHQKQTPQVILNRAVVLAQLNQAAAGIDQIMGIAEIDSLLKTQYIFAAVLGDLFAQCGDAVKARQLLEQALLLTPSIAEKNLIREKINKIC